jgi:exopolyphosphatase/guanosine-5'-triphosphate,3'-diphosphate pyrophosphatase
MEDSLQFAAVDIGSNAVRLFFGYVFETKEGPVFKKASLIRLPIRLGEDSFHQKEIQTHKVDELIDAMKGFKFLMKAFKVISYRVCATSAMRDAPNGKEVVKRVKKETGIQIELIDGETEASLIFQNHVSDKLENPDAFIYMDVGGGSTEYTLFQHGEKIRAKSFNIGTIRLKDNLVPEATWKELTDWLTEIRKEYQPHRIIGSGGNINTLFKLSRLREMEPLKKPKIKELFHQLKNLSYDEKISKLGLRPDRADVIVPATELFLFALAKSGCNEVLVPKVGLVDGIMHQLYDAYVAEKNAH